MQYGFTDIVQLLGALGLFLYGMKVMSDALMVLAGDRMRTILATTTSNRVFAVVTGFAITAIIQSSSATTLMVIGFVNAGLLTLTESIGVIMGANIGTTVTAWLISLLGFKVNIAAISLPVVGTGFALTLSKHSQQRHWGGFLIGFGLLFIGLEFLKDSVPDIGNHPETLATVGNYTGHGMGSVLLFLAIGTVLTLVVQSSSATMALTLLMAFEGWIPYDMSVAMVLGQNVGTTITANLAALIANYQAKRAALAHLVFNLVGVVWGLVLFYPMINGNAWLTEQVWGASPLAEAAVIPVALALFHTLFNIANTLLLIGFVDPLARLMEKMVREVPVIAPPLPQAMYLTPQALNYPQTGLKALTDESLRLLEHTAYELIAHGLKVHRADLESDQKLKQIVAQIHDIDLDLDKAYNEQVKAIYLQIQAFATELESRHELDPEFINALRSVLLADRMLVRAIRRLQPLHDHINQNRDCDNEAVRREYNLIRHRLLKVVREIHRIRDSHHPERRLEHLLKRKEKAEKLDGQAEIRIDKLLLNQELDTESAYRLLSDSAEASEITRLLVDISETLYAPRQIPFGDLEQDVPALGDTGQPDE